MNTEDETMATVTIYGASDDLIEVNGDLREEFGASGSAKQLLFSDGTKVQAVYSYSGVWRLTPLTSTGTSVIEHTKAPEDDDDNYSDRLTLTGNFEWVECWDADGPADDDLRDKLDEMDWGDLTSAQLLAVYRLAARHTEP